MPRFPAPATAFGSRPLPRTTRFRPNLATRAASLLFLIATAARADGPADNSLDNVRRVPPPGIAIPSADQQRLNIRVTQLGADIENLRRELNDRKGAVHRLPDIIIFHKAVDWALRYDEFFQTNEVQHADRLLDLAATRVTELRAGRTPWMTQPGPAIFGYQSKIDGSIQPYGLVIPDTFATSSAHRYRLDFWFHGRGEKLSELAFLAERSTRKGEFVPPSAFVLHPYGRYCNGSRFAGETDAWEAYEDVRQRFAIDEDRVAVRGFSLGGASCWHMATHHAWRWAAAAPGAGFSETAEFLRVFQNEELQPAPWEQKLWRLYDATDHALNVTMVPLVAYSGENDRQIQAAQAMEKALAREGIEMTHLIGPKTGHSYEPQTKRQLEARIDALVERGRDPVPRNVRFVVHTLRYPRMAWVIVDGLAEHWEPARIEAEMTPEGSFRVQTTNVTALTLDLGPGLFPFAIDRVPNVVLNGQSLPGARPRSDRSWKTSVHLEGGTWKTGPLATEGLRKVAGLQGPIDDAFLDSFLFVRPTRGALSERVGAWAKQELDHAVEHWRRHYRGEVRIKDDTAVTEQDQLDHHLILWGDPKSNSLIERLLPRLPIRWDATQLQANGRDFGADQHVPVLVYPNPANPRRYVVLNSGFTFREYDYLNNARQTPKLPDWAVVDVSQPATARAPGRIAAAGFFGERWEWK